MEAVTGWWDDYFWGSVVVVQVFFASLVLMVLFGLIGAGAKLSDNRTAKRIAGFYTVIFRGTPEILVILLLYFGSAVTLTAWRLRQGQDELREQLNGALRQLINDGSLTEYALKIFPFPIHNQDWGDG